MSSYFDDSWEIIIFKEFNLKTLDEPHPFNNKNLIHLGGHIFARKNINKENINIIIKYLLLIITIFIYNLTSFLMRGSIQSMENF